MSKKEASTMNIGIVGGSPLCREILEKTNLDFSKGALNSRITAVADPDPMSPGVIFAKNLGLNTVSDYHELYGARYDIHLLIILLPEQQILEDILRTRPQRIRVLSYHVFELFWKAIGVEEKKLRERTKEMETILNGIRDNILVINPDMEIAEANEAFLTKIGRSRENVIGRRCYEIFQKRSEPCTPEEILCPLKEVIRNKRHARQVMSRTGANGEVRRFEVNIYPIWKKHGKVSRFIEISRDITSRLKEEEEMTRRLEKMVEERTRQLKETHTKLLHQDKMSSLGKLAASVVHEVNNPIAGILNLILLMKRILGDGELGSKEIDSFGKYLNLMETETLRVSRIVSNLLAFARQSKMESKLINPNRIIEQTLLLNGNLLKILGVKVHKRLEPNLPDIVGSEDQIQQAFMNFISNAAEAMEGADGGILTIESAYSSKDNMVLITFRDTGVGIPQENLSKLFEPFFTTKRNGKGVGLGLSVAYGIIQEHGGSIYVQSRPGKGATFRVKLPLKQGSGYFSGHGGFHGHMQNPHSR